jgi:hypothetical protein
MCSVSSWSVMRHPSAPRLGALAIEAVEDEKLGPEAEAGDRRDDQVGGH